MRARRKTSYWTGPNRGNVNVKLKSKNNLDFSNIFITFAHRKKQTHEQ